MNVDDVPGDLVLMGCVYVVVGVLGVFAGELLHQLVRTIRNGPPSPPTD